MRLLKMNVWLWKIFYPDSNITDQQLADQGDLLPYCENNITELKGSVAKNCKNETSKNNSRILHKTQIITIGNIEDTADMTCRNNNIPKVITGEPMQFITETTYDLIPPGQEELKEKIIMYS